MNARGLVEESAMRNSKQIVGWLESKVPSSCHIYFGVSVCVCVFVFMTKCGLGRKVGEQFMKLHFPHLLQLRKICGWNWYKSAQYDLRFACLFRCLGVAQKYVVVGIFLHKLSNLGQCYDSFTCTVYTNKYTIYAFSGVLANESHFGSLWLFVSF